MPAVGGGAGSSGAGGGEPPMTNAAVALAAATTTAPAAISQRRFGGASAASSASIDGNRAAGSALIPRASARPTRAGARDRGSVGTTRAFAAPPPSSVEPANGSSPASTS